MQILFLVCEWGAWEEWGPCSVPCGYGTRNSTRRKVLKQYPHYPEHHHEHYFVPTIYNHNEHYGNQQILKYDHYHLDGYKKRSVDQTEKECHDEETKYEECHLKPCPSM